MVFPGEIYKRKLGWLPGEGLAVVKKGMNAGSIRFGGPEGWIPGNRFLRFLLILLFWTGGFYTLLVLRAPHAPEGTIPTLSLPAQSAGKTSGMGPIRYVQRDPQQGHRPQFSVSLDEMIVKPGNLGLFKTGLYKTVQIRSLQMRRYEYPSDPGTQGPGMDSEATVLRVLELNNPGLVKGLFGTEPESFRLGRGIEIQVDRPDVSDAGQFLVENFDYRVVSDGQPRLSIRSKRAFASWEESGILLRGGVMITAADGPTVRSNRIRWDTRNHVFSVEDNYLLTQGPSQTAGNKIYLDEQLHIIDTAQAVSGTRTTEGPNYAWR
jgi:hypothetical protein